MEAFYKVRDFDSVRDIIDMGAELFGDRPAFEIKKDNEHFNITYSQYRDDVNSLSSVLIDKGITDQKAAVCADNCYEYCLTYISVICSGGVIVPVDKELYPNDIYDILRASGAKFLFCDKKAFDKLDPAMLSGIEIIQFKKEIDDEKDTVPFESFVSAGRHLISAGKALYKTVEQDTEKMCTLLFTSGTTGISKGVMLCQRNFVFEVKAAMGVIKIIPDDCGISLLPLHHTFESSIILFFAPYCGAKVTFCEGFKYVLRNMKEFNPSIFVAVPLVLETVHKRILKEIKKKKNGEQLFTVGKKLCKFASRLNIDLKKVVFKEIQETFGGNMRMIICGGAPLDPKIIEDFDAFGIQVVYGYGLTECAPLAIINHDRLRSTDSIGEPLPGVETKIINKDENGIGELCVKGGMVMLGYYNNPEATAEVMDDEGFFHTGDLSMVDKKGHYHITGRCKNVIVTSNGKNIYPEELEYHLDSEAFIASSLVEGTPDSQGNLEVTAQIFPDLTEIEESLGDCSDETVKNAVKSAVANVNSSIPGYKRIKHFTVRKEDFERTTAKKIKRGNCNGK